MKIKSNKWNANLYNTKHAFVYKYGEDLVKLLDPRPKELILDLGCGSGQLTNEIYKLGAEVIGIDSSVEMIKSAKSKYAHLQFFVKDASNFKMDKSFDAIFSNAVLHWVLDAENAVITMRDNLKTGGRLVVEFGGKGNVQTIIRSVKKALTSRGIINNAELKNWFFPSISTYTTLLEKNGFKVNFAQLYDRPTALSDTKNGIKDWLLMFGSIFFESLSEQEKNSILMEIQEDLREKCFSNGKWYADYKRIRVRAQKI